MAWGVQSGANGGSDSVYVSDVNYLGRAQVLHVPWLHRFLVASPMTGITPAPFLPTRINLIATGCSGIITKFIIKNFFRQFLSMVNGEHLLNKFLIHRLTSKKAAHPESVSLDSRCGFWYHIILTGSLPWPPSSWTKAAFAPYGTVTVCFSYSRPVFWKYQRLDSQKRDGFRILYDHFLDQNTGFLRHRKWGPARVFFVFSLRYT